MCTSDLIYSIISNSLDDVKALLDAGEDVNCRDTMGMTPLMWSVQTGNQGIFDYLVAQGAQAHHANNFGETALSVACCAQPEDTYFVKSLIALGVDVNTQGHIGKTPLMDAATFGKVDSTTILLNAGADIHLEDQEGRTALHWALVQGDNLEVASLLLKNDGDINAKDHNGGTPLDYAMLLKRGGCYDYLVSQGALHNVATAE